jgi:hypothetical protein
MSPYSERVENALGRLHHESKPNRKFYSFDPSHNASLSLGQAASAAPYIPPARPAQDRTALQVSPEAPGEIFLPLLPKRYPFTPAFGIDLGRITVENGLNEMAQAGAQWVRRGNYFWPQVEPNKGDRNWEAIEGIESELADASANGLNTILVVQNTPAWARQVSDSPCGPIKPEELPAFASFMHDLVARYSQPPYNVKYWEIVNEPDAPVGTADYGYGCWGDRVTPLRPGITARCSGSLSADQGCDRIRRWCWEACCWTAIPTTRRK